MKQIAILITPALAQMPPGANADARERDQQMAALIPALAAQGMEVDLLDLADAGELATNYDAALPLLVWGYSEGLLADFQEILAAVDARTRLLNPRSMLEWNLNKRYLDELAMAGVPVIPTRFVDQVTEADVKAAFDQFAASTLVIKPQIGGGSWRQVRLLRGAELPPPHQLPPGRAMIQPFLPAIVDEGEYSFLFFGGQFSHALVKRPIPGDYRIQSAFGGVESACHPGPREVDAARAVVEGVNRRFGELPLYARVDLVRGGSGALGLMELELIEPYFYLAQAGQQAGQNRGAMRFATALADRLGR